MGTLFFDKYSLLHLATGIIARFWNIPILWWIVLHTLFEYLENTKTGRIFINTYLTYWPGGKPSADTFLNNIGDTIFGILGWLLADLNFAYV